MKQKKLESKKNVRDKTGLMIYLLFICFTLCLSVGYAVINSELKISGEANFRVEADIRITDISLYETTNLAVENYTSKYSKNTITIGADLKQVNSSVSYKIKVANSGTVSMWIDNIVEEAKNNSNTEYLLEGIGIKELINPGEEKEFIIKIKYKDNVTELPSITNIDTILKFNFIKPESTLVSGNNGDSTTTFFNGTLKKEEIESIEFMPTLDVVEDAIGSWDASASKNGTVIASYKDSDGNGLYELYIGGIGIVNAPAYANNLLSNFINVKQINFGKYFDTSSVKTMGTMFGNCKSLTNLNLSSFDTKNVYSMISMFLNCSKLGTLNLSSFDTSSVVSMESMFNGCSSLTNLDLSAFNTSKVTNMRSMFLSCYTLTNLNLLSFNTSKVTTLAYMFDGCSKLTNLDVSSFDTANVTTMMNLFNGCESLKLINLSNFNTPKLNNMGQMFLNCSSIEQIDISNFDTSKVTDLHSLFNGCKKLTYVNASNFNTSKVKYIASMFMNCYLLNNIDVSNWDV